MLRNCGCRLVHLEYRRKAFAISELPFFPCRYVAASRTRTPTALAAMG